MIQTLRLPRLPLNLGLAALTIVGCHPDRGGSARSAKISVSHAVVPAPPRSASDAPAFLVLDNRGSAADALLGVTSPEAGGVMLHAMIGGRMEMVTAVVLPPGTQVRLVPGSDHLMLHELAHPLVAGDTVTLELRFEHAEPIVVRAPVLRYTEAVEAAASNSP